jgi:hypothetical protein
MIALAISIYSKYFIYTLSLSNHIWNFVYINLINSKVHVIYDLYARG